MLSSNVIRSSVHMVLILSVFGNLVLVGNVAQAALLHHYQAEGNANDSAGTHHGTAGVDVSYVPSVPGLGLGQAFSFLGDSLDADVKTNEISIPESGHRTVAFWIKSDPVYQSAGLHIPLSQGHSETGFAFQYGAWGADNLALCCRTAPQEGNASWIDGLPKTDGDWHHVAYTYNGDFFENRIYVDGALDPVRPLGGGGPGDPDPGGFWFSEATSVDADPPFTFTMGSGARFPQRTFQGQLDDVRIYDHELSAGEVAELANNDGTPDITFFWGSDVSGDWNDNSNWTGIGAPPDNTGESAVFGDAITTLQTVFTNTDVAVNDVQFDNSSTYVVSGGGTIHLTAGNSVDQPASGVTVDQGSHQFQAAVQINNDVTVDIASGATLIFNNALNLMGNTLTKTGAGEMAINNVLTTGGGAVQLLGGIITGNGTVGADVNNEGGTISPGSAGVSSSVPEPTGLSLAIFYLVGILLLRVVRR